jgi:hypothetical protein
LNVGWLVKDRGRDAQTVWRTLTFEMRGPPRDVRSKVKRAASKTTLIEPRPAALLSWDTLF